jgi:hypothetical protein
MAWFMSWHGKAGTQQCFCYTSITYTVHTMEKCYFLYYYGAEHSQIMSYSPLSLLPFCNIPTSMMQTYPSDESGH